MQFLYEETKLLYFIVGKNGVIKNLNKIKRSLSGQNQRTRNNFNNF